VSVIISSFVDTLRNFASQLLHLSRTEMFQPKKLILPFQQELSVVQSLNIAVSLCHWDRSITELSQLLLFRRKLKLSLCLINGERMYKSMCS
jgi:hypothetical protein